MGRPRQTKIDPIKYVASRDGESKTFASRLAANQFVSTARRTSKVEAIYWKCRYWVLEVDRVPRPGEEHLDEESYTGKRLWEREAVLKGTEPNDLTSRAEGLRRASFERHWLDFRDEGNLRQLSPNSRKLALECAERFYERYDERLDREEAEKARKRTAAAEVARIQAIPTVMSCSRPRSSAGLQRAW